MTSPNSHSTDCKARIIQLQLKTAPGWKRVVRLATGWIEAHLTTLPRRPLLVDNSHATHPALAPHSVALRSAGLAASALARIVIKFGAVV